jgi:glutamate--cysteine ligase
LAEPQSTPSARLLDELRRNGASFFEYTLEQSRRHAQTLLAKPLPADKAAAYAAMARDSLAEQKAIEAADTVDFGTYVSRYHQALKAPGARV